VRDSVIENNIRSTSLSDSESSLNGELVCRMARNLNLEKKLQGTWWVYMVLGNGPFLNSNSMFDVGSLDVNQPSLAKERKKEKRIVAVIEEYKYK